MPPVPEPSRPAAPAGSPAPDLEAERRHLADARADLQEMRARTLALNVQGGDAVSEAYLAASLYRRARSLEDDPSVPLFFGRIDTTMPGDAHEQRFHIGRRHVMDDHGDPVVIDWRADVSTAFYRATQAEPMGVSLRRRFGFAHGDITSYEDEHLTDRSALDVAGTPAASRILTEEIERPRVGPMRDIVATIQPEQDVVVRTDLRQSVCVQGAPGTGKTAVGLHRVAYLLHAFRDRLARTGTLVVGPNRAFLHYIAQVLPALGEVDVRQLTVQDLVAHVPVRRDDPPEVGVLKGDARMAQVLRRAVWSGVRDATEPLVVPRGTYRWRIPAHEVDEAVRTLRERGESYGASRALLAQRLAHRVLLRMEAAGEITDDVVQNAVARSRPVRAYADTVWPAVDPAKTVIALLSQGELLASAADGILTEQEQALLRWGGPAKGIRSAPWSAADAVLVDEARGLVEREQGYGHVVLDEAQDLSPMELRAVGRRAALGSVTVLGDIAQGTTPWATPSWEVALEHLGHASAHVEVLRKGYRVPAAVVTFASRLLPSIAPGVGGPQAVRSNPGRLDVREVPDLHAGVIEAIRAALGAPGSVGVIAADSRVPLLDKALRDAGIDFSDLAEQDDTALVVVPASLAKGLEYDHVVVVEPAEIVAAEPRGLRRLYVVLTRAVSSLAVVHTLPLPAELVDAGDER